MPAITRVGDSCSGHSCYPGRPSSAGSGNVYVNGIPVVRQGDQYETHCCGPACHSGTLSAGSSTVFVNGLQCGRIGDPVDCGSAVAEGSTNVFAGG